MNRFKNVELAEMYKVSEKSIRNWIDAAKKNKLNLQLIKEEDKAYIANTPSNHILMKDLALKGKKFKNRKSLYTVKPKAEFYKIFNENQIIDIISNLEINKEVPPKYFYFNGGAKYWDSYIDRVLTNPGPITIKSTLETLNFDKEYIYTLIKKYSKVNVVDIGAGNARPLKEFIEFLSSKDLLRKYIAIDYSPDMLEIAEKNTKEWFGEQFPFEGHIKDITTESLQDLLYRNTRIPGSDESNVINLIFYVGSTIENQRSYDTSLHIIKRSMGLSDIFILGQLLDTDSAKIHLYFNAKNQSQKNSDLDLNLLVLNLLNIKEDYYDVERMYDENQKARIMTVNLKVDLKVEIETSNLKQVLSLNSRDKIIIYRHNHHTNIEVINTLSDIGFDILHSTISTSGDYLLLISKIKSVII